MAWEPESRKLWTAVNERDELGSDLVPDYMTSVRDGGFYGWPYSYYGAHVDARVEPQHPELVATAIVPDYALGPAHRVTGADVRLGRKARAEVRRRNVRRPARLVEPQSLERVQGDLRARSRAAGRRGMPIDVLTGFVDADGQAMGARSESRSTSRARCSWRTTSATRSGGSPPQPESARPQRQSRIRTECRRLMPRPRGAHIRTTACARRDQSDIGKVITTDIRFRRGGRTCQCPRA